MSPKGAIHHQPRATPWDKNPPFCESPEGAFQEPWLADAALEWGALSGLG